MVLSGLLSSFLCMYVSTFSSRAGVVFLRTKGYAGAEQGCPGSRPCTARHMLLQPWIRRGCQGHTLLHQVPSRCLQQQQQWRQVRMLSDIIVCFEVTCSGWCTTKDRYGGH
jgi:hypothetical protein